MDTINARDMPPVMIIKSTKMIHGYAISAIAVLSLCTSATAQWSALPDITMPPFDGGYAFVINDKIYVGQGNELRMYDPMASTWQNQADFPGLGANRKAACAFVVNNKGYVGLGYISGGVFQTDLWEYDPMADTWSAETSFPGAARGGCGTFTIGGKGYVCGGVSSGPQFADVYSYDPVSNVWTLETSLPTGTRGFPTAWGIGNFGYVYGGYTGFGNETAELHRYDPVSNTWTAMANYPGGGRRSALAFVLGNQVLVGMGHVGGGTVGFTTFYLYNTATDSWTTDNDFSAWSSARIEPVGAVVGNTAYMGTGSTPPIFTPNDDWWSNGFSVGDEEVTMEVGSLMLYPCPAKDHVMLWLSEPETGTITVHETSGAVVLTASLNGNSTRLSLDGLAPGLYWALVIGTSGNVKGGRVLKL